MSSIQIQSVLYKNEKEALIRSLEAVENAVVNSRTSGIDAVSVRYGDASEQPLFSAEEIARQLDMYKTLAQKFDNIRLIDAEQSPDAIVQEICRYWVTS